MTQDDSNILPVYSEDGRVLRFVAPILSFEPLIAPSAGIFDAPSVWVCVNTEWWSRLVSRLYVLVREDAWQGDNEEQVRASQEIEKLLAMANCEDCSDFITDIRVDPVSGQIEKKVGGAWIPANGDGGDTTVLNTVNNVTDNLYPPLPLDETLSARQRACNIATGMTNWILAKFDDSLDAIDAVADTIAAADAVLLLFPPLYLLSDQVSDMVNEVVEATTSAIRALMTVELTEEIICQFQSAIDAEGAVTDANYADLMDSVHDAILAIEPTGVLELTLQQMFTDIQQSAFISRANMYQINDGFCPCGDCFINPNMQISFDPDDPRWILDQGTYDPDTGIISSDTTTGIVDLIFCLRRDAIAEFDWLDSSNADDITPGCFYDATHVELEWRGLDIVPPPGGSATFHRMATTQADVSANVTHWNTTSSIGNLPTDWLFLSDDFVIAGADAFYLRVRFETENLNAPIEIRNLKLTVALP